ncbi:tripartite tricarboxylate transporter TctB family protein [Ornithinicoccus hortensis]|uniref:Putative tricarboxylic transport membrane protein n=1 Tax=Ornithinicoccus hortensis TaxID=82346 RepID=A0A542YQG4_9MICO|nr:tripartite tricarboxylate transporter TctB family protein [Ornithinicoccus hortensis]TQL50336.1 putative tricarboxylic transport membrane protein [Ornithinicoccus hortensis]
MTSAHPEQDAPVGPPRSGRSDVIAGLVVAAAGAVLLVAALNIGDAVRPAPGIGPGTLPTFLAAALVLSGLALSIVGLRKRPVQGIEAEVLDTDDAELFEDLVFPEEPPIPWGKLAVHVALFIGYALVFIPLGYILSTALYLTTAVTLIDPARWKRNLIYAVLFGVIVYFGFTELLSVRLPAGVLG